MYVVHVSWCRLSAYWVSIMYVVHVSWCRLSAYWDQYNIKLYMYHGVDYLHTGLV